MDVLDEQHQGLLLTQGKEEVLHGLKGSELTALGIEGVKLEILHL